MASDLAGDANADLDKTDANGPFAGKSSGHRKVA